MAKTIKDRNFDDLLERFEQRVYGTDKGEWRLQLLQQDLAPIIQSRRMAIWDAGCGMGQLAAWLASQGHQLTLCDISAQMLQKARALFAEQQLEAEFFQLPAQQLADELPGFDLVCFHAVLEWLAEPLPGLNKVIQQVRPGGYLSLLFYNRNAMVYQNVLKGHWRLKPILEDSYLGKGNKLSPPNPQFPHEIEAFLQDAGFDIEAHTGIRVFHDYLSDVAREGSDTAELFALEEKYCRLPTYRDMGRYVHLLAKRQ